MNDPTMQQYYAARAGEYDRVYLKPERQADLRAIEAWLPPRFAGRRVLELACGTGYWTQFLAPVARSLLAIDASVETLQRAARRPTLQRPGVRLEVGDAWQPPSADPPHDALFAGFWISHVPRRDLRRFLEAVHAVLAPAATLVLLDNRFVPGSSTPLAERDADGDTWQWRTLADGSRHRVLKNFLTEAELADALRGLVTELEFVRWDHYWALRAVMAPPAPREGATP